MPMQCPAFTKNCVMTFRTIDHKTRKIFSGRVRRRKKDDGSYKLFIFEVISFCDIKNSNLYYASFVKAVEINSPHSCLIWHTAQNLNDVSLNVGLLRRPTTVMLQNVRGCGSCWMLLLLHFYKLEDKKKKQALKHVTSTTTAAKYWV